MKDSIKNSIKSAIEKLYPGHKDIEFSVDYAPENIHADFASNAALVLAKELGKRPMEIAGEIASAFRQAQGLAMTIETAPPGFLNFKVEAKQWIAELKKILKEDKKYGSGKIGKGKNINLESVSANPTGPLTVGHGRGAVIGLVLSNIFKTLGYKVVRDYYYNDAGLQMKKLGQSVKLSVKRQLKENTADDFNQEQIDLYMGAYIGEIAAQFVEQKRPQTADDATVKEYADFAAEIIFGWIKNTLNKLGVGFDNFVRESDQKTKEVLEQLEKIGIVYEKDGAKWLKNAGGREDRVLVRKTGEPTYRLPDIAYHLEKVKKYDKVVTILGADHITQFPDISYAVEKLGGDSGKIWVIINQFVTLGGGKKMSTRKAEYVTLDELIAEVGADVAKFFLAMNSANSHMVFDLDLAKDTSEKNPVYKVQYAHARIESIKARAGLQKGKADMKLLQDREEMKLIRELAKFPEIVGGIADTYNVHHLPHYLLQLAESFHSFYEKVRVVSDDADLTSSRLALVEAAQTVFANGLRLMGIEPMNKM
ncbi:MAG: arginine--tRNA ligase [Candidatus Doudnabacteria bacterium]|nr:arginine--tRNA ligase [bacterium]MDZ4243507.1 arginine--tRNA ligase [Candidatus Doudnabacteria bacterium]